MQNDIWFIKHVIKYSSSFQGDICNDFKAGNKVRSVVATKKLALTGIFGANCKHDIPIRFVNMKHGERLAADRPITF